MLGLVPLPATSSSKSSDCNQLLATIKCWILPAQDCSSLVKVENRLIWHQWEPLKTNLTSETTPSTTTRPEQGSKRSNAMNKVLQKVSPFSKRKITPKETWSSFWTKLEAFKTSTSRVDLKPTVDFTMRRLRSGSGSVSYQHHWLRSYQTRRCKLGPYALVDLYMRLSLITIWSQPRKPSTPARTSALFKCCQVHIIPTIRSTSLSKDLRRLTKTGLARVLQAITRRKSFQQQEHRWILDRVWEETKWWAWSTTLKEFLMLRVPTTWINPSKTRPMVWFQEELCLWIGLRRHSSHKAWEICINRTSSTSCKRLTASSQKGQEPRRNHLLASIKTNTDKGTCQAVLKWQATRPINEAGNEFKAPLPSRVATSKRSPITTSTWTRSDWLPIKAPQRCSVVKITIRSGRPLMLQRAQIRTLSHQARWLLLSRETTWAKHRKCQMIALQLSR